MSHRHRNALQTQLQPAERRAHPIPFQENKKAPITLLCPFCSDHHVILPNQQSPCGTRIEVQAVQEIFRARTVRQQGLICVKCKKGSGEMIRYGEAFIHLKECNPGMKLIHQMPPSSKLAHLVFSLPKFWRGQVEKIVGYEAQQIQVMDETGETTGEIAGYFFRRINGKHTPAPAG